MLLNLAIKYQTGLQRKLIELQELTTCRSCFHENSMVITKLNDKQQQIDHRKLESYFGNITNVLTKCIANKYNLNSKQIILSNSSEDFLSLLCLIYLKSDDEVIISEHGSMLYKAQVLAIQAIPVIIKDSNNKIDVNNIINTINSRTKMIFVTIPTNPATSFLIIREINHLARLLIPTNIILILDMSCSECIDDDCYSIKTFINTVIIKTLSSTYDLVSFSLGWMHCNKKTVSMIEKIKSPFTINIMTQIGSVIALKIY